jgi:hypothetical protein
MTVKLNACGGPCKQVNEWVKKFKDEIEVAPKMNYGGETIPWKDLNKEQRVEFMQKFMTSSFLAGIVNHKQFKNLAARYKEAIENEHNSLYAFDGADFKKDDIHHLLIAVNADEVLNPPQPTTEHGGRRRKSTKRRRRSRKKRRKSRRKRKRRKSRKRRRR